MGWVQWTSNCGAPPALKATVTICSTDDRYADDVHYMGGTLLPPGLAWAFFFFSLMCLPPDPMLVGDDRRAADFRWHPRSTAAPAPGNRRDANAICRTGGRPPEKPTAIRRDDVRTERIDRIALELSAEGKSQFHVEEDDPLSAMAELRRTQTMSRDEWQIRVETQIRLSSTASIFMLQGSLRASEGANEVCRREWDRSIPRNFTWPSEE